MGTGFTGWNARPQKEPLASCSVPVSHRRLRLLLVLAARLALRFLHMAWSISTFGRQVAAPPPSAHQGLVERQIDGFWRWIPGRSWLGSFYAHFMRMPVNKPPPLGTCANPFHGGQPHRQRQRVSGLPVGALDFTIGPGAR